MEITRYCPEHESDVLSAIGDDPDWAMFTSNNAKVAYRKSLINDVTYVCYQNSDFCGYARALLDDGFAVYVSELFVQPEWRNRNIGQSLLERFKTDYPSLTVYALSDEDAYYKKKGYRKIGSVFEL